MEINTTDPTAWESDSRTAAFRRNKRPRDLTLSDDLSSSGSANSTPRKRARRIGKLGHQDVRDFVPLGASFSSTPIPLEEQALGEDEAIDVETSLAGEELQNHSSDQVIAAQPLQDVQNGITASEADRPGSLIPSDAMVFVSEAKPTPSHEHPNNEVSMDRGAIPRDEHALLAEKDTDNNLRHKISNAGELTNSTTAPISWNPVNKIKIRTSLGGNSQKEVVGQVEQVSKDEVSGETREKATQVALRRLEGFRHRLSILDPHDGPVSTYKAAESELHDAEVDYNYCLYFPVDEDFIRPPTRAERLVSTTTQGKQIKLWDLVKQGMELGRPLEEIRGGKTIARDSNSPSSTHNDQEEDSASDGGVILDRKDPPSGYSGPRTYDSYGRSQNFERIPQDYLEKRGNESAENSGSGSGSESESESGSGNESESEGENESDSKIALNGSDASSDVVDEMIEYSNSEQAPKAESHPAPANVPTANRNARILADLNPQELNAQMRYFYITKTSQDVDRNTPVRCLVCAKYGHMSEACESLTCTACDAYNQHVTQKCPNLARCSKCRERGHDRLSCPYKLKNIAQAEIICDLCQRTGHTEEDCELVWRTSGQLWDSNLSHDNLRLSCYECGRSGHLGNGCPSRRPGKPPGTSSWGISKEQLSDKSGNGISIKGRAQHEPIDVDESEDEFAKFHRPKVPKDGPTGKIQINTAHINPMLSHPPASQWTPINEPYQDVGATGKRRPHEGYGAGNGRRSGYDAPQENNYRASYQRSLSPEPRGRHRDHRIDSYRPAEPREERRPVRGTALYRPMPSAARDQWNRHRL